MPTLHVWKNKWAILFDILWIKPELIALDGYRIPLITMWSSGYSPHRRRTFSAFPFSPQPPDGTGNTGRFSAIKRTTVLMGRAAFSPWQFRSSPCIGRSCGFRHGRIPERCEDRLHAHAGYLVADRKSVV